MPKQVYRMLKLYDYRAVIDAIINTLCIMKETGYFVDCKRIFGKFGLIHPCPTTIGMTAELCYCHTSCWDKEMQSEYNAKRVGWDNNKEYTKSDLKEISHKVFQSKMKSNIKLKHLPIARNTEIDFEYCFDKSTSIPLCNLFTQMQINFDWSDIENIIYVHSIFGQAYCNAVYRVSKYSFNEDGDKLAEYIIPTSDVIYEEFSKILKKYYFAGNKIDFAIFVCYVKDYLGKNNSV